MIGYGEKIKSGKIKMRLGFGSVNTDFVLICLSYYNFNLYTTEASK